MRLSRRRAAIDVDAGMLTEDARRFEPSIEEGAMSQKRNEYWDFLTDLLATGEIGCTEFRLQASDDGYSKSRIAKAIQDHEERK